MRKSKTWKSNPLAGESSADFLNVYCPPGVQDKDSVLDDERRQWSLFPILDSHETNLSSGLKRTYREQFLSSCRSEYAATMEAFDVIYEDDEKGPRSSLEDCREYAYMALDRTSGMLKVMANGCRSRWCPMCAAQKAKFARESVQQWVESLYMPRFLTLTMEHCEDDLLPQIEHLQDSFRRLRQRAFWKDKVDGGIWFLQVHRSRNDGCWHPHLHVLLEGKYIEQGELSDLWKLVSYGSYVLKIKSVHDVGRAAKYVARYSARPASLEKMPLADRVEMIEALHGKRLCGCFGTAKVVTLTPPKVESDSDWIHVAYYDTLVERSKYDVKAKEIMLCWVMDYPVSDELYEEFAGKPLHYVPPPREKKPIQYLLDFYK